MDLIADNIESEGSYFDILITIRMAPVSDIAVAISVQVLNQNGTLSRFGGWIVHYTTQRFKLQAFDESECIIDTKTHICEFLSGHTDHWIELQPGTFILIRR